MWQKRSWALDSSWPARESLSQPDQLMQARRTASWVDVPKAPWAPPLFYRSQHYIHQSLSDPHPFGNSYKISSIWNEASNKPEDLFIYNS